MKKIFAAICAFAAVLFLSAADDFMIGTYLSVNEKDFLAAQAAGVNWVITYGSSPEDHTRMLELAQQYGMKALVYLSPKQVKNKEALPELTAEVRRIRNHPAVGGWYLFDEPSIASGASPEVLRPVYEMLKRETPDLPVCIVNDWGVDWNKYSSVLDIQMVDFYPVNDVQYPNSALHRLARYTQLAHALGKPVITIMQTMSWTKYYRELKKDRDITQFRFPNQIELRQMSFAPLVQGSIGVFSYSYTDASTNAYYENGQRKTNDMWQEAVIPVLRELREFTSILAKPVKAERFVFAEDTDWLAASFKGAKPGTEYLLFVNNWPIGRKRGETIYLDGRFSGDYELLPLGLTPKQNAFIRKGQLRIEGDIAPWQTFVWEIREKK